MKRFVLTMILAALLSGLSQAAPLDSQASEAYRWKILLRTPKHPLFDARFRERLTRELKAALQPNLGLLASVEVIDLSTATADDPLIKAFRDDGFSAFEKANLPLTGDKYHGLSIDYRDGAFHLAARQFDGSTGLTTPMLRTRTVRSLDQIARAAGLLLEPDFGPVGTVEIILTEKDFVTLNLRGHTLAQLNTRVKPGDIFALSVIKDQAGGKTRTGTGVPYSFLKVVEPVKDGQCKCLILSRWSSPFGREFRRAAGVRAMKLATITTPLKIQVVDRAGKPHVRGSRLTINATDIDFSAKTSDSDRFEWRDGVYRSTRPFANVACIAIGVGADRPQLFPVPVLNDDVITLAFDVDPAAEKRAEFLRDCTDLRARIAELSTAQIAMVMSMNTLLDTAKNREALARAETGREMIAVNLKPLADELKLLEEQPGKTDPVAKEVLEACTRQLAAVRDAQSQLTLTITSLKDAIAKATNPESLEKEFRGRELASRIKDLLARGDVPEALAAYDKLIELYPGDATHKDNREKLRAEWTPKDDAHRIARECIRTLAAAKQVDEFKAACDVIKKAVPVMKQKNDKLGLRKLHNTFEPAIAALHGLLQKYEGASGAADKTEIVAKLDEVLGDLRQCEVLARFALKELTANEKK